MSTVELNRFLERAITTLQRETRFIGIAVAGSFITKTTDEFSDLDLVIVCEDASYDAILAEKRDIAARLGTLVASFTGEHVGEPTRLLICLYDAPILHVDLKFIKLADLQQRIEDPVVAWERDGQLTAEMAKTGANHPMPDLQWIEDRFWVWVHYAATKLGRGELFEVIDFLSFVRSNVLGPLSLVKHGQLPRGSRRLEMLAASDLPELLRTVATHDRAPCYAAIEGTVALYRKLRDESDRGTLQRNTTAEDVALRYLRAVQAH